MDIRQIDRCGQLVNLPGSVVLNIQAEHDKMEQETAIGTWVEVL
jgi:hypothetical protein